MPEKKNQKNRPPREQSLWGAYIPDIQRSYPDMPVKGRVAKGRFGDEFRPDPDQPQPKHKRHPELRNWITGTSYDLVVQKMREEADAAIKELQNGIQRLQRFIDNN